MNLFIYAAAFFALLALALKIDRMFFYPKRKVKKLKEDILKYWLIDDLIVFNKKVVNAINVYDETSNGRFKAIHPNGIICSVYYRGLSLPLAVIPFLNIDCNESLKDRRKQDERKRLEEAFDSEQEVLKMYVSVTKNE